MKSKLFISILTFVIGILPLTAGAVIKYSRSPSGPTVASPITFNIYADKFSDFGLNPKITHFYLTTDADYTADGRCRPTTNPVSFSEILAAPSGEAARGMAIYGFDEAGCTHDVSNNFYYLEGDGSKVIFTVAGINGSDAGLRQAQAISVYSPSEVEGKDTQEVIRELKIQILKLQIRILELRLQELLKQP